MEKYRIDSKKKFSLSGINPDETSGLNGGKEEGIREITSLNKTLEKLQEILYAQHKHRILIVLQAMDTGGKDGTIRSVFEGVNPQGVRVASFKVPTTIGMDHDYLWRIHQQTPAKGEIVIFNRSHYEDVLVVRVHDLVPKTVWSRRFEQINHFEKALTEEGTTILKFFLHISRDQQRERLIERINEKEKQWKFNPGDLKERLLWDDYIEAYEDVLEKTSTEWAPWYVIPANKNWYRNYAVSRIIVETLESLKMSYPSPVENISSYLAQID
jgi:PPK2 family polyphosphate:nucleotide phosphotransferase